MLIYWSKKAKSAKDQISSDSERTTSSVPNEQNASFNMNDLSFQNDMKVSSFISTNDYDSVIYDFISKESTNGDSLSLSFDKNISDLFVNQNIDENNLRVILQLLEANKANDNVLTYLIETITNNIKDILRYDTLLYRMYDILKDKQDKIELINTAVCKQTDVLLQSKQGCDLLIRIIKTHNINNINQILYSILNNFVFFACGKFSSFVIGELFQLNIKYVTDQLNYLLSSNFQMIFGNKCGNLVVMKSLEFSELKAKLYFKNEIQKITSCKQC